MRPLFHQSVIDVLGIRDEHTVLGLMEEIGWVGRGGMGPCPLPWAELKAFAEIHETPVDRFTLNLVRRLSEEWIRGHSEGSREGACLPPTKWREFEVLFASLEDIRDGV